MIFPEGIQSIGPSDRVLEIGPGGTPHPRANVFLEKTFDDPREAERQRGLAQALVTDRPVVHFDGGRFPFEDREFDYVICSQVLEHVEDVDGFVSEICRVARKGYIEYPRIYYEYLYNFREHRNILRRRGDTICWMPKGAMGLDRFFEVNKFFYESLLAGYDDLVDRLRPSFFEGFEWFDAIRSKKVNDIALVCLAKNEYLFPARSGRKEAGWSLGRMGRRLSGFLSRSR